MFFLIKENFSKNILKISQHSDAGIFDYVKLCYGPTKEIAYSRRYQSGNLKSGRFQRALNG
jgi:hypothetical protein